MNNIYFTNLFEGLKISCRIADKTKIWKEWGEVNFTGDYSKFYFFLDGRGEIIIEGKHYNPKPGQLLLIPSGKKHSYSNLPENTYYKYWCHFDCFLNDRSLFSYIKTPYLVDILNIEELSQNFDSLIHFLGSDDFISALRVKGYMIKILEIFLSSGKYSFDFLNDGSVIILGVLEYIDKNLDKKLMIRDLASMVHFHPNHFIRYFKEHIGKSPLKYIKDLRIRKAKDLLYYSKEHISEIANKVGYPDVEYFSKRFKCDTGFSPSDFRKLSKVNPIISEL